MREPDRRSVELNELGWWSKWAKLRWRDDGYVLYSDKFKEPFFNRGGSLTCRAAAPAAAWVERALSQRKMTPTFLAFEDCRAAEKLTASSYVREDTMAVLSSRGPVGGVAGAQAVSPSASSDEWASAYLRSFYGDEALVGPVASIVSSLFHSRGVTLLESRARGEVAGVLAIFRTRGVAGVYCVGTVPEHRRRGVASGLLTRAKKLADAEGRSLVLQTLESDGALGLYLARGFGVMYTKAVLQKRLK